MPTPPAALANIQCKSGRGAAAQAPDFEAECIMFCNLTGGWHARSNTHEGPPAVLAKRQCRVVTGRPRMPQFRKHIVCPHVLSG
eukprot:9116872-Pyramimonas_sp.AAC.1